MHHASHQSQAKLNTFNIKGRLHMLLVKMLCKIHDNQHQQFFLHSTEASKYIRLPIANIPDEIIQEYWLLSKTTKTFFVYIEVQKGMYAPPIWYSCSDFLRDCLKQHGYFWSDHVHGLWKHKGRPIQFAYVMDNFAVKYVEKEHTEHSTASLHEH